MTKSHWVQTSPLTLTLGFIIHRGLLVVVESSATVIACEFAVRPSASCRPHPRRRRHALRARLHGPQIRCDAISCAARPQSCLSRVAASASGCSAPTRAAPASVPTRACRRPASRLSPQALRLSSACATCRCAPSWPPPPCFVVPAACLSGAR
jgi:hypothetical protein